MLCAFSPVSESSTKKDKKNKKKQGFQELLACCQKKSLPLRIHPMSEKSEKRIPRPLVKRFLDEKLRLEVSGERGYAYYLGVYHFPLGSGAFRGIIVRKRSYPAPAVDREYQLFVFDSEGQCTDSMVIAFYRPHAGPDGKLKKKRFSRIASRRIITVLEREKIERDPGYGLVTKKLPDSRIVYHLDRKGQLHRRPYRR